MIPTLPTSSLSASIYLLLGSSSYLYLGLPHYRKETPYLETTFILTIFDT